MPAVVATFLYVSEVAPNADTPLVIVEVTV
jgi:hypothetical protein